MRIRTSFEPTTDEKNYFSDLGIYRTCSFFRIHCGNLTMIAFSRKISALKKVVACGTFEIGQMSKFYKFTCSLRRIDRSLCKISTVRVESNSRTRKFSSYSYVVESPYEKIRTPCDSLAEFIWKDVDKWSDRVAIVSNICNFGRRSGVVKGRRGDCEVPEVRLM